MRYQKLSLVDILRSADGSDCSNGGLSSTHTRATLLVPDGMLNYRDEPIKLLGGSREIDLSTLTGAVYILVRRDLFKGPYFHVEPLDNAPGRYMASGNYLSYSGNGFHSICQYPVPIHDRKE